MTTMRSEFNLIDFYYDYRLFYKLSSTESNFIGHTFHFECVVCL